VNEIVDAKLTALRREIRALGWILAIVLTALMCGFAHGRVYRPPPSQPAWPLMIAGWVIVVGATWRRHQRIETYNAIILATDPQILGDHIPMVKQ
jgi:membrane protease YdiL (CAAX protease family)